MMSGSKGILPLTLHTVIIQRMITNSIANVYNLITISTYGGTIDETFT